MTDRNLETIGEEIEKIDRLILESLRRRMDLSLEVERVKRKSGQAIFRSETEDRRIEQMRKLASEIGLNPHFAESLIYLIIGESCKVQTNQLQKALKAVPPLW